MSKKSVLLVTVIVAITTLFVAGNIIAGTTFEDEIQMNNPAYEHEKPIVKFTHAKHVDEYGAGCGECHHDDKGKPIEGLKKGDEVQNCIACHKKPGERPKGKDAPKLDKKQRLEYHAEALHYNCKDCHKEYNRENKTKAAPTTCTKCHVKP